LYYWDWDAEECVLIGQFEGNSQITGSFASLGWTCCEHDVGVKSINYPESGYATPDIPMKATVKNYGNNTETFDAQMEIYNQTNHNQSSSIIMWEDFSGTFPPEGWETDSFIQCNDSCSPDPPCACLFNYNQIENFSAYITSKPVDASDYEECNLRFYFSGDFNLYFCNFIVSFRKNESSPWIDVSPWDNPLGEQMEGDLYEIGIYSFGSPNGCGEALQIKWKLIGYSYYYNWFVLDSIYIEGCNDSIEYAELVEDITLAPGKSKEIEFPSWTPALWQDPDYENTWVDYIVHTFTICEGDQVPSNNNKYKFIELYFGFLHDVGVTNVSYPESGPAQTFPVTGHVNNFGQFNESGFNSYLEIAELDIDNPVELLTEGFSDSTFPPDGWTRTHTNWKYSSTNYAGGTTGEAKFYYQPQSIDTFRLYSPVIDTSEYEAIEIEFKHYVSHYTTPYILKLETSEDGLDWNVLWEIEPAGNVGPESISLLTDNFSSNTYISWTFEGNSWNINNWFVDDISIKGYSLLAPEYEDNIIISEIEPGEELALEFSDWTPDYIQYETTGIKKYSVKAWTNLEDPEQRVLKNIV
jgi:hypothetical protein